MNHLIKCKCSNFNLILNLIFFILTFHTVYSRSRITFDGSYNNILIALSDSILENETSCEDLIQNIRDIFNDASEKLDESTKSHNLGPARFGRIEVLIPYGWNRSKCIWNVKNALNYQTYDNADIKITTQNPFSINLPWTAQYKECGKEAESIYLSPKFLFSNPDFQRQEKSSMFLHEWAKFRYGIFEEYGYYDDDVYPACYQWTMNEEAINDVGSVYFTGCSDPLMNHPLHNQERNIQPDCKQLIEENRIDLESWMRNSSTSLMFAPHLPNGRLLCEERNHNYFAPNKQNMHCQRKSVLEVVKSHGDFSASHSVFTDNSIDSNLQEVQIEYFQPPSRGSGVAFIIEDTLNMRQNHLRHIKQSITLIIDSIKNGAIAYGFQYNFTNVKINTDTLGQIEHRENFIRYISDLDEENTEESSKDTTNTNENANSLPQVFDRVFEKIDPLSQQGQLWELFLFAKTKPTISELESCLFKFQDRDAYITVIVFDENESKDWLLWNKIGNTRSLIFSKEEKTNEILSNYFLKLLNYYHSPNLGHFHLIHEIDISVGNTEGNFVMNGFGNEQVEDYLIFFPTFEEGLKLDVRRRVNFIDDCISQSEDTLLYQHLQKINSKVTGCTYREGGDWAYSVTGTIQKNHRILVYIKTIQGYEGNLLISPSFGHKLTEEVTIDMARLPIYISVKNLQEQPIIDAKLSLNFLNEEDPSSISILLKDDGETPDLTKDDGIYSTYMTAYLPNNLIYTGIVKVESEITTKSIISTLLNEGNSALLDPKMANKCCGSQVKVNETMNIGRFSYSFLIPTFKTDGFDTSNRDSLFPPSQINSLIEISNEEVFNFDLEFIAPDSNLNKSTVNYYSICCSGSMNIIGESKCTRLDHTVCRPVSADLVQNCRKVSKAQIKSEIFDNTSPNNRTDPVYVYCGILGSNSQKDGPISRNLFQPMLFFLFNEPEPIIKRECKSIKDDCLPLDLFWGLIACIICLILAIIIISLIWYLTHRPTKEKGQNDASATEEGKMKAKKGNKEKIEKKNKKKDKKDKKGSKNKDEDDIWIEDYSQQHINNNNNINDNFNNISSNREMNDNKYPNQHVFINQAYIHDQRNGKLKLVAADGKLLDFDADSIQSTPQQLPKSNSSGIAGGRESIYQPSRIHPIARDRTSTKQHINEIPQYQNNKHVFGTNIPPPPPPLPPPTYAAFSDPTSLHQSKLKEQLNKEINIYASVNRNGRRTTNPSEPISRSTTKTDNDYSTSLKKYGTPIPLPGMSDFNKQQIINKPRYPEPPARPPSLKNNKNKNRELVLDRFPSSDSDTLSNGDSDKSSIPPPPPPPPPVLQSYPSSKVKPKPMVRSASTDVFNGDGQNKKAYPPLPFKPANLQPIAKPKSVPPPPPRPKNTYSGSSAHNEPTTRSSSLSLQPADSEDEDSDNWDDDDFDFPPPGETNI